MRATMCEMKLALIFAEFGMPAPDVTQYRETWPEADIQVYSEADVPPIPELAGPRYGWRMKDYWTVRKALEALQLGADVAICLDADMRIVDREAARTLPLLAERFGICMPANPRYRVSVDLVVGADSDGLFDESLGTGPSVNCSPIAIGSRRYDKDNGRWLAAACLDEMIARPVRAPIAWWRAMWKTGITPLILPPQWCVCERHIAIGHEIILHEGHAAVKRHYAGMGADGRWKNGG